MDPYSHGQSYLIPLLQSAIERLQGLYYDEPSSHCSLRIVFMGLRIAKVDQQAIAEVLGDMALKALDDLGAGGLIRPDNLPQVFRVEPASEAGGVHQIAKQYRELATFR